MLRPWRTIAVLVFCTGVLVAAEKKTRKENSQDASGNKPAEVNIVKVDAKNGTLTVRIKDSEGKEREKTYQLTQDVRFFDQTGNAVAIDVFESGDDALVLEREGKLTELRRPARAHQGRPSDLINVLVEMTDCDEGCTGELQRAYDILRRLDTQKNGHIDASALKGAREQLVKDRVDGAFKRLDKDHDGKISKEEARGMIKRNFDRLDRNRDGAIDRDELLQAATERQEHRRSEKQDNRRSEKEERK